MKTKMSSVKKAIMTLTIVLSSISINAQNRGNVRFGIDLNRYVNGNGHGGFYNPTAVINFGSHTFSMGPNWQRACKKVDGMGFTYSYSVLGPNTNAMQYNSNEELGFFITANYYKNAVFSKTTLRGEGKLSDELMSKYQNLKLSTMEAYAGMMYNRFLGDNFKLKAFIGIGYYSHLNYNLPTYHDRGAVVLMTGIGIGILK